MKDWRVIYLMSHLSISQLLDKNKSTVKFVLFAQLNGSEEGIFVVLSGRKC